MCVCVCVCVCACVCACGCVDCVSLQYHCINQIRTTAHSRNRSWRNPSVPIERRRGMRREPYIVFNKNGPMSLPEEERRGGGMINCYQCGYNTDNIKCSSYSLGRTGVLALFL